MHCTWTWRWLRRRLWEDCRASNAPTSPLHITYFTYTYCTLHHRDYLRRLPGYDRDAAYNYISAYALCRDGMKAPSKAAEKVKGTWGCNGVFVWGAISNGNDKEGKNAPGIQSVRGKGWTWEGVPGSRNLFAFRQVLGCGHSCVFSHVAVVVLRKMGLHVTLMQLA